jgi:hypothetical protein
LYEGEGGLGVISLMILIDPSLKDAYISVNGSDKSVLCDQEVPCATVSLVFCFILFSYFFFIRLCNHDLYIGC